MGDTIEEKKRIIKNRKRGRPPIFLDPKRIEDFCFLQATQQEMAERFGCSYDLIHRRYGEEIKRWRAEGQISLRREQWKSVLKGSVPMQIHLGKNWLGQRDTQPDEVAHTLIQIQVNNEP